MRIFMSFKMALQSIYSNKVRSALTMLGIIIGVLSVIIMVNLVNASMMDMRKWIDKMGTNIIEASIYHDSGTSRKITPADIEKVVKDNPQCLLCSSPKLSYRTTVKSSNRSFNCMINGVSESYAGIMKRELRYGKFFSRSDVDTRAGVAVIGEYVRQKLFGSRNPVGQDIRIAGEVFKVTGVFKQQYDELTEYGDDAMIVIPYTRAMRLFKNTNITDYVIAAVDADTSKEAEQKIKELFFKTFQREDYWVYNQAENMKEINDQINGLTLLAAAIAGISLLVGGIGIMNIMLVTVTERTREIGIRKAVGARTFTILTQFLIESAVISCIGGSIGIGLGIVASEFATMLMSLPSVPMLQQLPVILASFGFSAMVGIFFGFYPAFKAARLNPIDALRYE